MCYSNMSIEKIFEGINKFNIAQKKGSISDCKVLQIEDADFSNQIISDIDLSNILFINCNFENANIENVCMCNTVFSNCNLNGTKFCEPAFKKAIFPVFSTCTTDKNTSMPSVFQYKEMIGYTVVSNALIKVLASGNLAIDIEEDEKCCYSPFLKIIEILENSNIKNENIKENAVLNAVDYDADEFVIFESKEDAILYGILEKDEENIYSFDTVPFIKCKENVDYDKFIDAVSRYLGFHNRNFIVISYNDKIDIIKAIK